MSLKESKETQKTDKEKRVSKARLYCFGCPPGIRTPIGRVRVGSPTIERGGNRL